MTLACYGAGCLCFAAARPWARDCVGAWTVVADVPRPVQLVSEHEHHCCPMPAAVVAGSSPPRLAFPLGRTLLPRSRSHLSKGWASECDSLGAVPQPECTPAASQSQLIAALGLSPGSLPVRLSSLCQRQSRCQCSSAHCASAAVRSGSYCTQ